MRLKGKAKIYFQDWFTDSKNQNLDFNYFNIIHSFDNLPDSMQYGVYVDWFDSIGLKIGVNPIFDDDYWVSVNDEEVKNVKFLNRQHARNSAIEKANEIYNNRK